MIVPKKFKLIVRDERSRKQMSVVSAQLGREEIGEVINACDAGREGELIFAYLYEKTRAKKPVRRLWLNSMTSTAMRAALGSLRPAEEFALLEQAARSRSEADWIVGMNATRAANAFSIGAIALRSVNFSTERTMRRWSAWRTSTGSISPASACRSMATAAGCGCASFWRRRDAMAGRLRSTAIIARAAGATR